MPFPAYKKGFGDVPQQAKYRKIPVRKFFYMVQLCTQLRCLLFHGNGDFRGRVLSAIGRMFKTHNAVSGEKRGIVILITYKVLLKMNVVEL